MKELEAREAKDTKQAQAIEKAADKARNFTTAENIEAVAELQDAAMFAEEQAQQTAIGAQRKAIEAGKAVKRTRTKATTANYLKEERRVITDTDEETVSTRPNNGTDSPQGKSVTSGRMPRNKNIRRDIKPVMYDIDEQNKKIMQSIYDEIHVGDVSPLLQAMNNYIKTLEDREEKTKLVEATLEEFTGIKVSWNKHVIEISEDIKQIFKGKFVPGLYLSSSQEIAFDGMPTLGTIIHELSHARSETDENAINNLDEYHELIEDNIEEGLCELITMCIFKKMGSSMSDDITYEPYVIKLFQIYKQSRSENTLEFAINLLKTPNGRRFDKIKTIYQEVEDSPLTSGEIEGIIKNAEEAFSIVLKVGNGENHETNQRDIKRHSEREMAKR